MLLYCIVCNKRVNLYFEHALIAISKTGVLVYLGCYNEIPQAGPGQVAQLVRASSQYDKVVGSIPGQGIYKNQPMNA